MAGEIRLSTLSTQFVLAAWLAWVPMAAIPDTQTDLESARQRLAASRQVAMNAEAEFRTLLSQGGLTQSEQEDYRTYLSRLEQLVVENCSAVSELKALLNDTTPEDGCDLDNAGSTGAVSFPGERTEEERVIVLDGHLNRSMSEFDELLLREMDELKRRQSGAPDARGGVRGAGGDGQQKGETGVAAATDAGEEGTAAGTSTGEEGTAAGTSTGEEGTGERRPEQQQPGQQGQERTASRQTGGEESVGARGQGNDKTTTSIKRDAPPDEGDDDIVARQLREAAEAETDPELREKLWEEYRRYKADTTAKSN